VDRHLRDIAVPHRLLQDEHDLLRPPHGERRDDDLPALVVRLVDDLFERLFESA